jgi:hypothetical protein
VALDFVSAESYVKKNYKYILQTKAGGRDGAAELQQLQLWLAGVGLPQDEHEGQSAPQYFTCVDKDKCS